MAPPIFKTVILPILVLKVASVVGQSAVKQFLVTGLGPNPTAVTTVPNSGQLTRQAVPNSGLAALGALSLPGLIQALASTGSTAVSPQAVAPTLITQQPPSSPPCQQKPTAVTEKSSALTDSNGLDSNVLNNLAIALQLLIVSNLLNSNLSENEANPIYELLETAKSIPSSFPQKVDNAKSSYQDLQSYEPRSFESKEFADLFSVPNANFVGSSGFGDSRMMCVSDPYTKSNTRNNYQLMSPYDALSHNSLYSDPILSSPYGSIMHSKKDFHSPYVMMDSDPFANDLFR